MTENERKSRRDTIEVNFSCTFSVPVSSNSARNTGKVGQTHKHTHARTGVYSAEEI